MHIFGYFFISFVGIGVFWFSAFLQAIVEPSVQFSSVQSLSLMRLFEIP